MWPLGHWPGVTAGTIETTGLVPLPGIDLVDQLVYVAGNDYRRRDSRSTIILQKDFEDWPDLDGTIVVAFHMNGWTPFTRPCAIIEATGSTIGTVRTLDFELFAIDLPAAGDGFFSITMNRANGSVVTLRTGTVRVVRL